MEHEPDHTRDFRLPVELHHRPGCPTDGVSPVFCRHRNRSGGARDVSSDHLRRRRQRPGRRERVSLRETARDGQLLHRVSSDRGPPGRRPCNAVQRQPGDRRALAVRPHRLRSLQRQRRAVLDGFTAAPMLHQHRPVHRHHRPIPLREPHVDTARGCHALLRVGSLGAALTPAHPARMVHDGRTRGHGRQRVHVHRQQGLLSRVVRDLVLDPHHRHAVHVRIGVVSVPASGL